MFDDILTNPSKCHYCNGSKKVRRYTNIWDKPKMDIVKCPKCEQKKDRYDRMCNSEFCGGMDIGVSCIDDYCHSCLSCSR